MLFVIACQFSYSNQAQGGPYIDGDPQPGAPYDKDHLKEYKEFCEVQMLRRDHPEKIDKGDNLSLLNQTMLQLLCF